MANDITAQPDQEYIDRLNRIIIKYSTGDARSQTIALRDKYLKLFTESDVPEQPRTPESLLEEMRFALMPKSTHNLIP